MYPSAKFGIFSPYRCQVRNSAPFSPHFPNDVIFPVNIWCFSENNHYIGFPIGKYIWVPSFSFLVKPVVVMLHPLIAYLLFKVQLPLWYNLMTNYSQCVIEIHDWSILYWLKKLRKLVKRIRNDRQLILRIYKENCIGTMFFWTQWRYRK